MQKEDDERAFAEASAEARSELTRLSAGLPAFAARCRRALPSYRSFATRIPHESGADLPANGIPSAYAAFIRQVRCRSHRVRSTRKRRAT